MPTIDLNADVGEGIGVASVAADAALLALVSSANVSCGAHAGDEPTIRAVIERALALGCAVGAHPSFPDPTEFGRRELDLPPAEIAALVTAQVTYLQNLVQQCGGTLRHVKPHGALYNMAARSASVAAAIVAGISTVDSRLIVVGLSGGCLIDAALQAGLRTAREAFADRAYQDDGTLAPRSQAGAVHHDIERAIAQVRELIDGRVTTLSGKSISLQAETICLHGDTPGAWKFAQCIRELLIQEGYSITAAELGK